MNNDVILDARNLYKSFGGLTATHNVSFRIHRREIVGLIGPNGAGKTTIFNLISGFFAPDAGMIRFKDTEITGLRPNRICKLGISRTFQTQRPLSKLSVAKNVMVGAYNRLSRKEAEAKTLEVLKFAGLFEKRDTLAKHLTLAERKRLELARALACEPELLLLDETAAGLTQTETGAMVALILEIREKGVTVFMIEHVMKAIMSLSDRIYVIHHGRKICEGSPHEVSRNPDVISAYLGDEYGSA